LTNQAETIRRGLAALSQSGAALGSDLELCAVRDEFNAGQDTNPGLARPSFDPAHEALHAIEFGAVQGLREVKLEGVEKLGAEASTKRAG
jgi:hypothetical protein